MKKDIDTEIVEWSIQTFPDLTVEKQRQKLSEELREWKQAEDKEEKIKELADVYIVSRILADRFDCEIGKFLAEKMLDEACILNASGFSDAVEAKMKKNKARKWEKIADGTYHHKDEQ
jgi:hypothetical protein